MGTPERGGSLAGPASYRERTFYAGAARSCSPLVALVAPGGWRRKAPFALLGAFGAGGRAAHARPVGPGDPPAACFERVQNGRALLLFLFAVAVLAGSGCRRCSTARWRGARRPPWSGRRCSRRVAIAASPVRRRRGCGARSSDAARARDGRRDGRVALASVGWWLVFVAALAARSLLLVRARPRQRPGSPARALALLVALDMLHFAHGYQPMGPASRVVPPRTPAIAFLQRTRDAAA